MTLAIYSSRRALGQITLTAGKLTGSTPGLQDIADTAVKKAGGDPAKAYAQLDGFTNGYITIITDPAEQDSAPSGLILGLAEQGPHAAVPGRVISPADVPLVQLQAGHADEPPVERLPEAHPGTGRTPPPALASYLLDEEHASA